MRQLHRLLAILALTVSGMASLRLQAQTAESHTFLVNRAVPDGNAAGLSDVRLLESAIRSIASLRVRLKIAGEFNGDLYGYVRHSSGLSVLLNRPGRDGTHPFGHADDGFDVAFQTAATNGWVSTYGTLRRPPVGSPLTGDWEPDGRTVDPSLPAGDSPPSASLTNFNGLSGTGEWTLYLADIESGGTNTLVEWGLDLAGGPVITSQPASTTVAFGGRTALTVAATGSAPLGFQWHRGPAPLPGETAATLAFANAQPSQAGAYYVVVSDANGSVTSALASVTVTLPADGSKPTVTVTAPSALPPTVTSNRFQMSGTARDNLALSNVVVVPDAGSPVVATGTTLWTAQVELVPGTNIFHIQANDYSGNSSPSLQRSIFYQVQQPISLSVLGGGRVTGATNGQLLTLGRGYRLTATPNPGMLFSNWSGTVPSSSNVVSFVMQSNTVLAATFVADAFLPRLGGYYGLFYDSNNIDHASSGLFSAMVKPAGQFVGQLRNGTRSYPLSGRFALNGRTTNTVRGAGLSPLTIELTFGLSGAAEITGRVTDGAWSSPLAAYRSTFQAGTNPATAVAGYNTLLLPGAEEDPLAPGGDGFASFAVALNGRATLLGMMADGSRITHRSVIVGTDRAPVYIPMQAGKGSVFGWLQLRPLNSTNVEGMLYWARAPGPSPIYYTNGFLLSTLAHGSLYTPPGINPILDLDAGSLLLSGGNLVQPFTNAVAFGPAGRITNREASDLKITVVPLKGLFRGQVTPPGAPSPVSFQGIVLQGERVGGGFFKGTTNIGRVLIEP